MTLHISEASPHLVEADAVVIGVTKETGGALPVPGTKDVDGALGGTLAQTLATLGATGEAGEVTRIPSGGRLAAPLIAAVGMGAAAGGDDAAFDPEALRRAAGAAVRALLTGRRAGSTGDMRIALALPARDPAEVGAVALGGLLGGYAFRRYRTEPAPGASLTVLAHASDAAPAAERAQVLADAVSLVRDLVNTGPSDLVPAMFAARAEQVAADGGLAITVLDEHALAEGGYGGILGVGQGSVHPPRLVRLEHAPEGGGPDARAGREGDHLRLRRPVAQARQVDGVDEVGHGRRRRGARRDAGGRGARAARCGWSAICRSPRTCRAGSRQRALGRADHVRRHHRRGDQHRRGGTPGARRRARRVPPTTRRTSSSTSRP